MDRIEIEPVSLVERGERYRVRYAGTVLIESSRNPEFDACGALLAKGIAGHMEVARRHQCPHRCRGYPAYATNRGAATSQLLPNHRICLLPSPIAPNDMVAACRSAQCEFGLR
jgi:hypothetical protein